MNRLVYLAVAVILAGCAKGIEPNKYDALYRDLPFKMERVSLPDIPGRDFLLTDFGAKGDGVTLCTEAFAAAVAEIEKAGGGRLIVPAGIWFTGPVVFCSRMELHLESGAVMVFSPDFDLYPLIDTYFEGLDTRRSQSPVSARDAHDIAITGSGVIDGSGHAWRPVKRNKVSAPEWKALVESGGVVSEKGDIWYPTEKALMGATLSDMNVPRNFTTDAEWEAVKDFLRPVMISFIECQRVLLSGVTFRNSPAWNIHPLMCRDVILDGVVVQNPWYAQNGDGVDIESCEGVIVCNSSFDVGDDGICIKSGKDRDGRERGRPTRSVIVDNCTVFHGHGGFVVGSEMSGGVSDISVSNCRFLGTDVGLRFKSQRGRGGVVENIFIRDIVMTDIPTEPLLFDLYYGGKSAVEALDDGDEANSGNAVAVPVDEGTPVFRNIHIRNVVCNSARRAMFFNGLPEMNIRNVTVEECSIAALRGAEISEADSVQLRRVAVKVAEGPALIINNSKNVTVEEFTTFGHPAGFTVTGTRNRNINILRSSITHSGAPLSPTAANEVSVSN